MHHARPCAMVVRCIMPDLASHTSRPSLQFYNGWTRCSRCPSKVHEDFSRFVGMEKEEFVRFAKHVPATGHVFRKVVLHTKTRVLLTPKSRLRVIRLFRGKRFFAVQASRAAGRWLGLMDQRPRRSGSDVARDRCQERQEGSRLARSLPASRSGSKVEDPGCKSTTVRCCRGGAHSWAGPL